MCYLIIHDYSFILARIPVCNYHYFSDIKSFTGKVPARHFFYRCPCQHTNARR